MITQREFDGFDDFWAEHQTYHNLCNKWSVLYIMHLFLCYHGNWLFSAFGLDSLLQQNSNH